MIQGAHRLPHEVAKLTGTQLVALSKAANKEQDAVQIHSADDYAAWAKRFAEQNRPEVVLKEAKRMLAEED